MKHPISTYRIQFHKNFNLKDLEKITPYLKELGVKSIYASPLFQATPGSMHGYDIVNPNEINEELGSTGHLERIIKDLKKEGIEWVQDIVPNHMAYHSHNKWLMDVLEKGPQSYYMEYFDITWNSEIYSGKLMVPFLGAPLEEVIHNGEIKIKIIEGCCHISYYDNYYPIHPSSYLTILRQIKNNGTVEQFEKQINQLLAIEDIDKFNERHAEIKKQLKSLLKNDDFKKLIDEQMEMINSSKERLKEIINQQVYQLCYWQETNFKINFRRFFTINGLICLNIQHEKVFLDHHKLIKDLVDQQLITGIRVDHVDGMYDPTAYLQRLRQHMGDDTYIVVEKILEHEEKFPEQWPVEGNTGYDFLSTVNNLFTAKSNFDELSKYYFRLTNDDRKVSERIYEKKEIILHNRLAGELENLKELFLELGLVKDDKLNEVSEDELRQSIGKFLIYCPVYRYYGNEMPLPTFDQERITEICDKIVDHHPKLKDGVKLIRNALIKYPEKNEGELYRSNALHLYRRLMQFTGPLMAKGVEDTLMYTFSRFIGHNEVGDSPMTIGLEPDEFHDQMLRRQQHLPFSMNSTSTHDTKRGEDVRARLNVISDLPEQWTKHVEEWRKINAQLKAHNMPDNNDEYFIYQTLLGMFPMHGEVTEDLSDRLEEYLVKALREAKRHSNWAEPDTLYEENAVRFTKKLLSHDPFVKNFLVFFQIIKDHGIINSLSQVTLKYLCPGIPDLYQGCELWDLSLVDPDNRKPVDYKEREKILKKINKNNETLQSLWPTRENGEIKFELTRTLLKLRENVGDVLTTGDYIPLKISGDLKKHVLSFVRKNGNNWVLCAIPLNTASIAEGGDLLDLDWKDTTINLPSHAPTDWLSSLDHHSFSANKKIRVKDLFKDFPLAIMTSKQHVDGKRSAGVLLHITSLPSQFGVGDFGPEAYKFADYLEDAGQSYWQILPLNPTGKGQGYSPYSSDSSMAGNTLLISLEKLVDEGLLKQKQLEKYYLQNTKGKAEYWKAELSKNELFNQAFETFRKSDNKSLQQEFDDFKEKEKPWLHDYAMYMILKDEHGGAPWYEWVEELRSRNKKALKKIEGQQELAVERVKFLQFIFIKQWKELKSYCNARGIHLYGDLPFYVSHDSVDVWTHPEIFKLDKKGKMKGAAGVPPDYFNEDGQHWGMPVFDWKKLKKNDFTWWIQRIRKNMELYDLLRLDHFRAFSAYWEIPANQTTAKNGKWKKGPGKKLFKALKKELGELPFIAEDLGEITDDVYKLRDKYELPGMKVLQFAFGDDLKGSPHIPHNYEVNFAAYTGTHDNNTSVGWYNKDAGPIEKENLSKYVDQKISSRNIHKIFLRLLYGSVAKIAIAPMQDVLGLNENNRMNKPATTDNNWNWQLKPGEANEQSAEYLKQLAERYNRV